MAANTNPIYTRVADIQWGATALSAANTAKDGTGTVLTAFTSDATEWGYVQYITFRPSGTAVATVARVFINNGSTNATAANNILFREITLPAITLSEVAAQPDYILPINIPMPLWYKLNVTLGTAVAAWYYISTVGGKY